MSTIGLLDWDLTYWKSPTVFNIDLMQLAYYHKVYKRDIVQMLSRFESEKFTKVFISKDYEDYYYPQDISLDPKATWCGLTSTAHQTRITDTVIYPADTSIYNSMSRFYMEPMANKLYKIMLKSQHMRLTANGNDIIPNYEKQLTTDGRYLIFHDPQLTVNKDTIAEIQHIRNKYLRLNSFIGFKYPLYINNLAEYHLVIDLPKIKDLSGFYITDFLPNRELIQNLMFPQTLTYYIDEPNWTPEKFIDSLPKIFMQSLYLSTRSINLLLKIGSKINIANEWRTFVEMYNSYIASSAYYSNASTMTFFSFVKYAYNKVYTNDKIRIFNFIKENNPRLFNLLYGAEYISYDNGKMKPHMYTWAEINARGGYGGYEYQKYAASKAPHMNYIDLINVGGKNVTN